MGEALPHLTAPVCDHVQEGPPGQETPKKAKPDWAALAWPSTEERSSNSVPHNENSCQANSLLHNHRVAPYAVLLIPEQNL
jgi:hypothetical protein